MKIVFQLIIIVFFAVDAFAQDVIDSVPLKQSLDKATATIRSAFEKGDATLVGRLHSPEVIKYFGGNNVQIGREAVERIVRDWLQNSKVEFVENTVEDTKFIGKTAIQTVLFAIKSTPKNGGQSSVFRGRSMVIYIQDKNSPTGWLTIREITQEAPAKSK